MTGDLLQQFLDAQLFSVEGQDERLAKIREATADLSQGIDGPRELRFLLTATNPKAHADNASIEAARKALGQRWNSYSNVFSSPPIGLFRGMLLQATTSAAAANESFAAGCTLLLRNILPRRDFGKESGIWKGVAEPLDLQYEGAAATSWSDNFKSAPPKALPAKIDRTKLSAAVVGALSPTGVDGKPGTNPNPHNPNANEPWAHEAASRITVAIGDALDALISQNVKPLEARLPNAEGVQRRTRLLWWKEARYSAAANTRYDELSPIAAAIIAAVDLQEQLPLHTPRSVEAFIQAAVATFATEEKTALGKWADQLQTDPGHAFVASKLPSGLGEPDLLSTALQGGASKLYAASEEWSPPQITLALFRELQALRAFNTGQV